MSDYLTLDQAAEIMPVSKSTLYKAARAGEIGSKPGGEKWVVRRAELDEWYDRSRPIIRRREADEMPNPSRGRLASRVVELRRSA